MAYGGKCSYKYKFLIYVVYVLDLWPFVYDFGSKVYKYTHKHTSIFIDGALSRLVGASVGAVYAFKWASLRMSNALLMRALI